MNDSSERTDPSSERLLAPVREGDSIANKYVVGRVLGVGGMGVVVAATDKLLGRTVAIKFLLPALSNNERAVQRFIREARSASKITSEHVVKLLEIDRLPNGMPYFVMEYLEGHDLHAMMAERGTLSLTRAVDYLMQALEAIAEGHLHGVVHRDLKPSNLFVTRHADGTPLVKVLDFGIAKTLELAEEPGLTGSDDVRLGSPAYMSPEQLQRPSDVDARSDVWALGVTLYELVCGSLPFRGQTYAELVLSITSSAPEPISSRRAELTLPRGMNEVVMRCLEKERSRRYESAAALAAALAPFGSDQARVSLKRINGLAVSPAPGETGSVTATLPSDLTGLNTGRKSDSTNPSKPRPLNRVAAAAALVAGLGIIVVAWSRRAEETTAVSPPAPRAEDAKRSAPNPPVALETAGSVTAVATAPRLEAPAPSARSFAAPALAASSSSSALPATSQLRKPPTTRATAERTETATHAPSSAVTASPAPPAASSAAFVAGSQSAQPKSRSETIEKLIEKRR